MIAKYMLINMRKIVSNIFVALLILCFASQKSFAECLKYDFYCKRMDNKNSTEKSKNDTGKKTIKINNENSTELNFYSGMFDFSDDGKKSVLFGLEHKNEELFRESFLGTLSPITGGMITADNAVYLYTGVQAEYDMGPLKLTPSFAPGYYNEGGGKDLGYPLEFKSEVQLSYNLSENSLFGMSYNHISNASLGNNNPGANSYSFNFLKKF